MTKSHVSLEANICAACGAEFRTDALLLDTRLRSVLEQTTVTGWGFCHDHQKQLDEGYVFLIVIDPEKSETPFRVDTVHRTGEMISIKRSLANRIFADKVIEKIAFIPDTLATLLREKCK